MLDFKCEPIKVVKIKVTIETLNDITTTSGFDWLYDYDYKTSRQMTLKQFVATSTDEQNPPEWFINFCNDLKREIALDATIMFDPS